MAAPLPLTQSYTTLVNRLGMEIGLRKTSVDVITDGVANSRQAADILQCIQDGLLWVYNAYEWSFLQPVVSITTIPAYAVGTVTVDASGNVTGTGTTFPSYAVSASGWLYLGLTGAFAVQTYSSGTALVLANYHGPAITAASGYVLWFNAYPLPSGIDSLKGPLTYPPNLWHGHQDDLRKLPELELRRRLHDNCQPGHPVAYCQETSTFDPTHGSSRYIMLWPPPHGQVTLSAIGTVRPTMLDSTNLYPIGVEVMACVLEESCLAAWERNIERKDAGNPDAVHGRALTPLLQQAIELDKRKAAPETLGVSNGDGREGRSGYVARIPVYLDIGGGVQGWFG
jgi:hypothetical protein